MELSFNDVVNREDFKWGLLWFICRGDDESDYHYQDYINKNDIEFIKQEMTKKFNYWLLVYAVDKESLYYFNIMMNHFRKMFIKPENIYSVEGIVEQLILDFKRMNHYKHDKKYFELLAHAGNRLFRNYHEASIRNHKESYGFEFNYECHCMELVQEYFKSIGEKCKYGW